MKWILLPVLRPLRFWVPGQLPGELWQEQAVLAHQGAGQAHLKGSARRETINSLHSLREACEALTNKFLHPLKSHF